MICFRWEWYLIICQENLRLYIPEIILNLRCSLRLWFLYIEPKILNFLSWAKTCSTMILFAANFLLWDLCSCVSACVRFRLCGSVGRLHIYYEHSSIITSWGVFHPNRFIGRLFIVASTIAISSSEIKSKFVFLWKNRRIALFRFSTCPLSWLQYGRQK